MASLVVIETAATMIAVHMDAFPLVYLGSLRLLESATIIAVVLSQKEGIGIIGLDCSRLRAGVTTGIVWSLVFALVASVGLGFFYLFNYNPIELVRVPLPFENKKLIMFFLVGGVIAPIAEEFFFRGILYTYFSQWGTATAVIFSTIIFVAFHSQGGITQAVGGLVFALAYHFSLSLTAPIIIHSLGNLALFSISFLARF